MNYEIIPLILSFLIIGIIFVVIGNAAKGVKSVGRTTKAIGKWNDERLEK